MNEIINIEGYKKFKGLLASMQEGYKTGALEEIDMPLQHFFAKGLYGRHIFMQAGLVVLTKIHCVQHITVALKGTCTVIDKDGNKKVVTAPDIWVTEPGTQRSLYCHTDCEWLTVHADEETDVKTLENKLTCNDYQEFQARALLTNNPVQKLEIIP